VATTKRRASEGAGKSSSGAALSQKESRDVEERRPPSAVVVFETVRREGEDELERPAFSLASSGLAAGLSMGFSFAGVGLLRALLPDVPWRPLLENLGYTVGFLIVILGRQQLFTENTLTVILPLLDAPNKLVVLGKVARLWGIVLAANIAGAFMFALAVAHSNAFPADVRAAFEAIGRQSAAFDFGTLLVRGIFAGWMIALMVWLLPAADTNRPLVILIITYIVGVAGFSHIIAGSVEVLYLVALGQLSFLAYAGAFALPVFLGNCLGGVALVALLNYGQVVAEAHREG
jgi:formate-nitrite transporter family protein